MIKNFITLLRRYTTSSLLNVVGMSVAFAAIYLIMVQVRHDISFDRVIPNSERIYRLERIGNEGMSSYYMSRKEPDEWCAGIPEIEAGGSIVTYPYPEDFVWYDHSIKRNNTIDNFKIKLAMAEREGLEVFPIEFIEGGLEDFVATNDMVISEEVARKFDLKVGDVLYLGRGAFDDNATRDIVGIFKNFPEPSNIATCEGWLCMEPQEYTHNNNKNNPYYVRLKEGASYLEVQEKIGDYLLETYRKEGLSEEEVQLKSKPRLNPLPEIYFDKLSMSERPSNNKS